MAAASRSWKIFIGATLESLRVSTKIAVMFRTRFTKDVVAEFLPPDRHGKRQRVIILCDGMPSTPRKQPLVEFLAAKGYWVFYPRWRGAGESGGRFLEKSPNQDVLDIVGESAKGVKELAFGESFSLSPDDVFVIGGSFRGAAALLSSLDPRVKRVVANCCAAPDPSGVSCR